MIYARAWTTSTKHFFRSHARKLRGVYLFPKSAATPVFRLRWFFGSRLARRRHCAEDRIAGSLRELRENHVIGIAQQAREFLRMQSVPRLQRNPLRSRQVRRGNDARPL